MSIFNSTLPPGIESAVSDIEKQFISMRAEGSSIRDIAKTLKKSTNTICNWNRKFSDYILGARNKSFCELQKKIIDLKNSRIDFLKSEIERISNILRKKDIKNNDYFEGYDSLFARYIKISDILTAYENDVLSVGVNFKDNILPESNLVPDDSFDNNTVIPEIDEVIGKVSNETADNTDVKISEKQNRNTITLPKKFFHKKQ